MPRSAEKKKEGIVYDSTAEAKKAHITVSPSVKLLGQLWFVAFAFCLLLSIFIAKLCDILSGSSNHVEDLFNTSRLTIAIYVFSCSSFLLQYKLFRFFFHLASILSWIPLVECIVATITSKKTRTSVFIANLLFVRQPQWFPVIMLCTIPWIRAYYGEVWMLKNYLISSTSLLAVLAYIAIMDGTCNKDENENEQRSKHVYCRSLDLMSSSSGSGSIQQLYGGRKNFIFLVIFVFVLCHIASIELNRYLIRALPSLDAIENSTETELNQSTKTGGRDQQQQHKELPDDCQEISMEDALKLVEKFSKKNNLYGTAPVK